MSSCRADKRQNLIVKRVLTSFNDYFYCKYIEMTTFVKIIKSDMKHLISRLYLATLLLGILIAFPSCSDDSTENDATYSRQLVGSWQMVFTSDQSINELRYHFSNNSFEYQSYTAIDEGKKAKVVYISGTWNIQKGVLQLYYDLDSFRTEGMSAEESFSIKDGFSKDNMLLADMNADNKPYGPTISFGSQGGIDTMRLSSINGTFVRVASGN